MKKKKTLIIIIVACFVLAAGCLAGGLLLHSRNAEQDKIAQIEAFVQKNRKEFDAIDSSGVKTESDKLLKAGLFKRIKDVSESASIQRITILKHYDAFRIVDLRLELDGDEQTVLLLVYLTENHAVMSDAFEYQNTDERADKLTDYIRQLDSSYSKLATQAKKLSDDHIIY